jgi:hypothetical protein
MLTDVGLFPFLAAFFLVLGLVLILLARYFEQHSQGTAGSLIIFGLVCEVISMVSGFLSSERVLGVFSGISSLIILVWSAITYLIFLRFRLTSRIGRENALLDNEGEDIVDDESGGCGPKLEFGKDKILDPPREGTWRSYLSYFQLVRIRSNSRLEMRNEAEGGHYYGLWFSVDFPESKASLLIVCRRINGECNIIVSEEDGPLENRDGGTIVVTAIAIAETDKNVAKVAIKMGAALSDSGPQIRILPKGIGVVLNFPDASLETVNPMGTFTWSCNDQGL